MTTPAPVPAPAALPLPTAGLRPHPLNARLYGAEPELDGEFLESIRDLGVLVPLTVLPDGAVVSGHRRLAAAQRLGLVLVPTVPYPGDPDDETELTAAIIAYNRQRVKTAWQFAQEVAAMLEVETERARRRQAVSGPGFYGARPLEGHRDPQVVTGRAPQSRDIVGQAMGMGVKQVQQAAAVVKGIDRLIELGDYAGAEHVRQALNERGLAPAYKEIRKARGEPSGVIRDPEAPATEKRNAIPHDAPKAAAVIRKNFTRDFAVELVAELQGLLRGDWP